jgi:hypothetical protein
MRKIVAPFAVAPLVIGCGSPDDNAGLYPDTTPVEANMITPSGATGTAPAASPTGASPPAG